MIDGYPLYAATGETVVMGAAGPRAELAWVCGGGDASLAVGVKPSDLMGKVLRCGQCRSYNRVETGSW